MWTGDWSLLTKLRYKRMMEPLSASEVQDLDCTPLASTWLADTFGDYVTSGSRGMNGECFKGKRAFYCDAVSGEIDGR